MGSRLGVAVLSIFFLLAFAGQAMASGITNAGEDMRTGWYPDEPSITPEALENGSFGKDWEAPVEGQVYAQPLLDGSTLLVATEKNQVYGLDPVTGTQKWHIGLGTPWNPEEESVGCGDLTPRIGVTSTPVIDPATNVAYMTHKTYVSGTSGPASWYMDAIELATGHEKPGFPVPLSGTAQNGGQEFEPTLELQRPGLLLLEGVVYAGFGSDCDFNPFKGWVFGVSESEGTVKARWTSQASGSGSGIWQSGAGLVSDGPGTILLVTGNGATPAPGTHGNEPPGNLGESVVRLRVQGNGELQATDFFAPANAKKLGENDIDFASSGITGLPDSFGTPEVPHLAAAAGKEGYLYLLNRDNLGGIATSEEGELESVMQKTKIGGVWSRPGVWPGQGGWVYIPTASPGMSAGGSTGFLRVFKRGLLEGLPHLFLEGSSSEEFGFSSGAPVITSNGTTPESALVWVEWTKAGSGVGAQLRAYAPVPVGKVPHELWHESIGTSAKFAVPGVGGGRLFVGTRDGRVLGFGLPLSGAPAEFLPTLVGHSSERTITLTASKELEILNLSASPGQFAATELTHPTKLKEGETVRVPVTFTPTSPGSQAGALIATIRVSGHEAQIQIPLSGTGEEAAKPPAAPPTPTPISPSIILPFEGPGTSKGPGPLASLTSRTIVAGRNGTLSLRISCPAGESTCAGTVLLQTLTAVHTTGSKRARILTLASASFRVGGGHTTTVHLHLSPFGRRLLARNRQVRLRAVIAAHDAAGLHHTTRLIVTVRAARLH
jgi:hypothetical protein